MGATVPETEANKLLLPYLREMVNEPNAERFFQYNRPGDTTWQKDAAIAFLAQPINPVSSDDRTRFDLKSQIIQVRSEGCVIGTFSPGDRQFVRWRIQNGDIPQEGWVLIAKPHQFDQ